MQKTHHGQISEHLAAGREKMNRKLKMCLVLVPRDIFSFLRSERVIGWLQI